MDADDTRVPAGRKQAKLVEEGFLGGGIQRLKFLPLGVSHFALKQVTVITDLKQRTNFTLDLHLLLHLLHICRIQLPRTKVLRRSVELAEVKLKVP